MWPTHMPSIEKKNPNYYTLIDSLDSQQFNKHNDEDDDNTDD